MKYSELSKFEKFIILVQEVSGVPTSFTAFCAYTKVVEVLEKCSKSDSKHFEWKDKIIEKPISMYDAEIVLTNVANNKWDQRIIRVSNTLSLELRR
jgi:hypothetical protein